MSNPVPFIQVGVQDEAVLTLGKIVLDILRVNRSDEVTKVSLETLSKALAVHDTTITNCTFAGNDVELQKP